MLRFWLIVLVASIVLFEHGSADDLSPPKFSTNVTWIVPGRPFTSRCDVGDFLLKIKFDFQHVDGYYIGFWRSDNLIGDFGFDAKHQVEPNFDNRHLFDVSISAGFHNRTIFEFTIVPQSSHTYEYWCRTVISPKSGDDIIHASNKWTGKVAPAGVQNPEVHLLANTSEIAANKPFTIECTITNFESAHKNYSLKLMRTSGLVGTFEVYAPSNPSTTKPQMLFLITKWDNITVEHQPASPDSTTDIHLLITQKNDISQNYWCQLEDHSVTPTGVYQSNRWPNKPLVQFTANATHYTAGQPFTAECVISNFDPEGKTYSVLFQYGRDTFAYYRNKPGQSETDFEAMKGTSLGGTTSHYGSFAFPKFGILVQQPESRSGHRFGCALSVESASRQIYYSNEWN